MLVGEKCNAKVCSWVSGSWYSVQAWDSREVARVVRLGAAGNALVLLHPKPFVELAELAEQNVEGPKWLAKQLEEWLVKYRYFRKALRNADWLAGLPTG